MKKDWLVPLAIAGLSAAFLGISLLVFLSRGNPSLIKRKLKIGALLLTLTGAMTGCNRNTGGICYAPDLSDDMVITEHLAGNSQIEMNPAEDATLSGEISDRRSEEFSFRIDRENASEALKDEIVALDGRFDEDRENFEIALPQDFPVGTYRLSLYNVGVDHQLEAGWRAIYILNIVSK
jgi:hypothetical protein